MATREPRAAGKGHRFGGGWAERKLQVLAGYLQPRMLDLRDPCQRAGVAFSFRQWGGTNKKQAGRLLEGRSRDQLPVIAA